MSNLKHRFYATPSSLASYFGCGFNSPEEQFAIDTAQEEAIFDQESMDRMALGNHLEDAVINYFQDHVFKTPITERNSELKSGYDGKIRYKIDGMMELNGVKVGFENKVSNAKSGKFTENFGYHIQCHAYMLCEDVNSWVLGGLYQGKPIWTKLERNEELINDIKEMVDFLVNALQGLVDFYDDYPNHILAKYSRVKLLEPIKDLSDRTIEYFHKMAELNAAKKKIEDDIKILELAYDNAIDIEEGTYEDDFVKVKISSFVRKPSFDLDKFKEAHADIDLTPYYGEPTVVKTKRITSK